MGCDLYRKLLITTDRHSGGKRERITQCEHKKESQPQSYIQVGRSEHLVLFALIHCDFKTLKQHAKHSSQANCSSSMCVVPWAQGQRSLPNCRMFTFSNPSQTTSWSHPSQYTQERLHSQLKNTFGKCLMEKAVLLLNEFQAQLVQSIILSIWVLL